MTEEEKLEKARPFLNGKFWALFESTGQVSAVAVNGYLTVVTEEFQKLFGYNEDECRGMHFKAITDPVDYDTDQKFYESLLRGEREKYTVVKRYIPKRGERFDAILYVRALHDDSSNEIVAVVSTITPLKHEVDNAIRSSMYSDVMERNAKEIIDSSHNVSQTVKSDVNGKDKSLLGRIGEWSLKFVESIKGLNVVQSILVAFLATLTVVGLMCWYYLGEILEAVSKQ